MWKLNHIKGALSDYFINDRSVCQGQNLSSLLFSLILNNLEESLILDCNFSLTFDNDNCNKYLKMFVLMNTPDTVLHKRGALSSGDRQLSPPQFWIE